MKNNYPQIVLFIENLYCEKVIKVAFKIFEIFLLDLILIYVKLMVSMY